MDDPESPLFPYARIPSGRREDRFHTVVMGAAFVVVAAILFGAASLRPF